MPSTSGPVKQPAGCDLCFCREQTRLATLPKPFILLSWVQPPFQECVFQPQLFGISKKRKRFWGRTGACLFRTDKVTERRKWACWDNGKTQKEQENGGRSWEPPWAIFMGIKWTSRSTFVSARAILFSQISKSVMDAFWKWKYRIYDGGANVRHCERTRYTSMKEATPSGPLC